jgi:ADP-ribosylglycohydrolase
MRVGPIGYAFDNLTVTLSEAEKSAEITHNHPDGIKGAKAVASAVFLARNNYSKNDTFTYHLERELVMDRRRPESRLH